MKYETCFKAYLETIEKTLESALPGNAQYPASIHEAMRYSVFPGGKRFRPILTLAACEAAGGKAANALLPAAAIELVHCYSLVHDDLPSLDNDDLRRGKPTCHKQFGEALAVLAGDGLLTLAFQILGEVKPAGKAVQLISELSTAAGTYGMIGGQVAELKTEPQKLNLSVLDYISIHKTGKLIKASAVCGAIAGGASRDTQSRIQKYGEFLGLAFQSVDDLLDGDGYLKMIKARDVYQRVRDLIANAKREVKPLGNKAEKMIRLADYLVATIPRGMHAALDQ